jgi:hypothetical protein
VDRGTRDIDKFNRFSQIAFQTEEQAMLAKMHIEANHTHLRVKFVPVVCLLFNTWVNEMSPLENPFSIFNAGKPPQS